MTLRARWLGPVAYDEGWAIQEQLFAGTADHLLLCEHPPVYTLGVRGDEANLLVDPSSIGAEVHRVNRGGDITFHGPGQLVGYPILSREGKRGGGMADTVAYVTAIEQLLIDVVADLGVTAGRVDGYPGIWVDPDGSRSRKLAAVGVRLTRGRTMHGFALNVDVDLGWFDHMVPCGIAEADKGVTSLAAEGVDVTMREVVDLVSAKAGAVLTPGKPVERQDVAWERADAGVPVRIERKEVAVERKPSWMRVELSTDENYRRLKSTSRKLDLTTVCEEAGCPNIFECWNEGTATFMLLGERCTRACGFCLVDTRKPSGVDLDEPQRVADAIAELGIEYAVLTMVARDDLDDGGASIVARTVDAIRATTPGVGVEVLISDLQGSEKALATVATAEPDVINHNIETVARLQRAVRPSASYARSLALLARTASWGHTTKSGLILGLGEEVDEVRATMADLGAIGVDIVTVGQYLRPTADHLPVARWWSPDEFEELKRYGETELGIAHVEASPLTRSSHHAGSAHARVGTRSEPRSATLRG